MLKQRSYNRSKEEFRPVSITRNINKHAEGSCLIKFGDTHVICTATVEAKVPAWIKEKKLEQGWVSAEYSMLPRSTGSRMNRDARRGSVSGRTLEIQRLISRSLRAAVDLEKMPGYSIVLDCDVIQADGGTRTTSINGACLALYDACQYMVKEGLVKENPFVKFVGAISLGINNNEVFCDLDYLEDSSVGADCNLVLSEDLEIIEFQLTAEKETFNKEALDKTYNVGTNAICNIISLLKNSLNLNN